MPQFRRSQQLDLLPTDIIDLKVLQTLKPLHMDCNRKHSLQNLLNSELQQNVASSVANMELHCGPLTFDIAVKRGIYNTPGDTKNERSVTCDLTNFGQDGCLDFLKTSFDTVDHITIGYLCDPQVLGQVATKILISFATRNTDGIVFLADDSTEYLRVLSTTGFQMDNVFGIDSSSDENLSPAHQALQSVGLLQHSKDSTISIVRYVCSKLITRLTNMIAIVLGSAIDKLEDRPVNQSDSFVVVEPAAINMRSRLELKPEYAANIRQAVTYHIQDCVLNRLITIQ